MIVKRRVAAVRARVASGDPLPDGAVIWTRATPAPEAVPGSGIGAPVTVEWVVARDRGLRDVVRRGTVRVDASRDHTVKVDVRGLAPGTTYAFGFFAVGAGSPVGRLRTAPDPAATPADLRFGVAACANLESGWFAGYRHLSRRADLDFVLHVGDYVYPTASGELGPGPAIGRVHRPQRRPVSLADHRLRHACYRDDPDLRAFHAAHTVVHVWDGDQPVHADDPAVRAAREWLPIREQPGDWGRLDRVLPFGTLATLFAVNAPRAAHAIWFLAQYERFGLLKAPPPYAEFAEGLTLRDLYERVAHRGHRGARRRHGAVRREARRRHLRSRQARRGGPPTVTTTTAAVPDRDVIALDPAGAVASAPAAAAAVFAPVPSVWLERLRAAGWALAGVAGLALVWQLAAARAPGLPSPVAGLGALVDLLSWPFADNGPNDKGVGLHLALSLWRVFTGFGLAALIGVPLGLLLGSSRRAWQAINPLVQVLRPVSPLAWFPIWLTVFRDAGRAPVFVIFITALWLDAGFVRLASLVAVEEIEA